MPSADFSPASLLIPHQIAHRCELSVCTLRALPDTPLLHYPLQRVTNIDTSFLYTYINIHVSVYLHTYINSFQMNVFLLSRC